MVPVLVEGLEPAQRARARALDAALAKHWRLGRNLSVIWCRVERGVRVLMMPFEVPAGLEGRRAASQPDGRGAEIGSREDLLRHLVAGCRYTAAARLDEIARILRLHPVDIHFPGNAAAKPLDADVVDAIVRLYSISAVQQRAVALVDIVGFSLCRPLQQVTQLNSLNYSINAAQNLMMDARLPVQFVRSTAGDGFYLWNQDPTAQGNAHLYFLLHLILAENAIARHRYEEGVAPRLTAAFHIGDGYEFNQIEGLHPALSSYIVGDVTIELARILAGAQPDQILIGDFRTRSPASAGGLQARGADAVSFVDALHGGLKPLHRLKLGGKPIKSIKCYLTGKRTAPECFEATRVHITDKHGHPHEVYNAKLNIHRAAGAPIFLGLQHKDAGARTACGAGR